MYPIIFVLMLLLPILGVADPKICLNMIVKNESAVIRRCLDSVIDKIDYWVIVDTGSTDGTQEIILDHLKDIPGELYERPWKNFGESRSEAFDLAWGKGEYILFMDADDVLEFDEDFDFGSLVMDQYCMWRGSKEFSYIKPQLVRGDLPWRWVGVTHEYLDCPFPYSWAILDKVRYICVGGGARSVGIQKFLHNIELLTEGLKKEPYNSRYMFYLAESYRDAGQKGNALETYQKRVKMGGWNEEVFWSKLQIAHLLRDMDFPPSVVEESYLSAHLYRPHRAEPLYYLAEYCNRREEYQKAYAWIKMRDSLPVPHSKDNLFNEDWIDDYGLLFQLSICAYYVGEYQESLDACDKLIAKDNLPEAWHELAISNRVYPLMKLNLAENY